MKLKIFGAVVLLALMSACGGSKPQAAATPPAQTVNIPDFITNRPQDTDEYLYEVGIGKSPDLSMGMSIAKDNGRGAIAEKISVQLGGMIKNFSDQVADGEAIELDQNFERVRETVYQQSLSGVSVEKQEVVKEEGLYVVYMLMKMPVGKVQENFMKNLTQDQELMVKFKSTKAFEELNSKLDKGNKQ